MFFKKTLAAAAVLVASFGFTNSSQAQDWTGAYFGGFGAASFMPGGPYFSAGTIAGYDVQFGTVVLGVNFRASQNFGLPSINIEGGARVGFVLADNFLVYANAALGAIGPVPGSPYYSFGGGVEMGITDTLHVFGEFRRSVIACCGTNMSVHFGVTLHN